MMKKLLLIILTATSIVANAQQASMMLPTQATNPKMVSPPNMVYVDPATYRIWPVVIDSVKWKHVNMRWLLDTTNNHYSRLNGSYSNPSWISSLAYSKISGVPSFLTAEVDPTVPSYAKGLSSFAVIKPSTDVLYKTIGYVPSNGEVISAIGYTPYDASNPSSYVSSSSLASSLVSYATTSSVTSGLSGKFDNPLGTTGQYLRGNGSLATFPTIPTNTNQLTNGSGFITGYTETDPLWNAQKSSYSTKTVADGLYYPLSANPSSYVSSSSLASSLANYATTSALTSGLSGKLNNPAGSTSQYLRGDGSLSTFPTIPTNTNQLTNGSGFLTAETDPLWTAQKSGYSTKVVADGLYKAIGYVPTWSEITGKPTIPTYTAGSGIDITSNVISNTAQYVVPSPVTATRTLNSNFTISTTKQSQVNYSVSLSVTNPLLVGSSTAAAYLEYSVNAGSTWTSVSDALISSSVGVTVTVAITSTQTQILSGVIPANALARIRTTSTGTGSVVFVRGQETY